MVTNNGNTSQDDPPEPPDVNDLADLLDDLSIAIESENWQDAQEHLGDIDEMMKAIRTYVEEQIQ